jgi:N-acetylneuraminate synthase
MSGNHNQSLDADLAIVDAAAQAGADALKIQTYTADTMTLNTKSSGFIVKGLNQEWEDVSIYDLYKKAYTPWEWHNAIQARCHQHDMIFFSSPFDTTAVDFLETMEVPIYKIASFENTDLPLLRRVAATGKPVIMSTGMATVSEIDEAVATLKNSGCRDLILLKCTSSYPASPRHSNLLTIPHLRDLFATHVGLSDHTLGIGVAAASVAFGSVLIEKHFTLDRAAGGVDAEFSLEPHEFKSLRVETERAFESIGAVVYGGTESEEKSKKYRRSLYAARDIKAGERFTEDDLRCVRPALGLAPKFLTMVVGKKAGRDIQKHTPLSWDDIG